METGLRFGRLVVAAAVAVLVVGMAQLTGAPVDVYPQFGPPTVEIQAEALGLSAAEVEQLITVPLEQDLLNGVPWLDQISSTSMPGLSSISLQFDQGTGIYAARQMIQERLTQAHALPNVGSPPIMIEPLASAGRVAMVGLTSPSVSLVDLSVLARWKIRPRLMGIPGVANVSIYGQRDRQLQVQVDPQRLQDNKVTLTQVIETAGNALWVSPLTFVEASTPGTGGFVESPSQRLSVQHVLPISSPEQLSAVPVEGTGSGKLRLADVATVVEDHQPLIGDAMVDGKSGLYLVVQKYPGANTLEVSRAVEDAMRGLGPGLTGISVDTTAYRPATFLESALRNVGLAAVAGFVLLLLVLLLAFGSWRAAVVAGFALPVSLVAAGYVLYLRGTTFTTMTLLGLAMAVALVIDDAVTDVESARRAAGPGSDRGRAAGVVQACLQARTTMIYATLAVLVATVPFLVLAPLTTAFTRPLVLTVALAVLAGTLVALLLTPTLSALLLTRPARDGLLARPAPDGLLTRHAPELVARAVSALARPGRAWAAAAVLGLLALAALPQLASSNWLPAEHDHNVLVQLRAAPGTSLTEMDRLIARIGGELRGVSGVSEVGAHVGRAVTSDQVVDVNSAELWVIVNDTADLSRTEKAIRAVATGYPGVSAQVGSYPRSRLVATAAATRNDLVVRVFGEDLTGLQRTADQVRTAMSGVSGVKGARVQPLVQQPTAQIQVDLVAAQKYGLKPGDIRREATTLTSGLIVGNLYEQAKIFDVVVWGGPGPRTDLTDLADLKIDTPSGGLVALKDVATVKVEPQPVAINHNEVSRSLDVIADVSGRTADAVLADVKAKVSSVGVPDRFHLQVLSSAAGRSSSNRTGLAFGSAALIVVFLLLQAAIGYWRRAGLVLLATALSGVGAVLAAPLADGLLSAGAVAALFVTLALGLRGCLLTVTKVDELERADGFASAQALVLAAVRDRAVPVITSALATAAMIAPVVVLGDTAGLEILRPFAVTLLGGLVSYLLAGLLVLPAVLVVTSHHLPRPATAAAEEAATPVTV
jgi:Cu/Ag efflux pump CusA